MLGAEDPKQRRQWTKTGAQNWRDGKSELLGRREQKMKETRIRMKEGQGGGGVV
jgi:hypothetical protein